MAWGQKHPCVLALGITFHWFDRETVLWSGILKSKDHMRSFTTEYIPQGSKDPRHSIRHGQPSSSSNANHCKEKVMQTSHVTYYEHMDLWLNCSFSIGQPVLLVRIFTTSPTAHRGHWQGHWQVMRRLLSWRQMTEFLISAFLQIHVTIFFMMDFCFCLVKT